MKLKIAGENTQFPFLLIEDFFTEQELEQVWQEIDALEPQWKTVDSDTTGNRTQRDGRTLATSDRVYLDEAYADRSHSMLQCNLGRIGHEQIINTYEKYVPAARTLRYTNSDRTILARYSNTQAYERHIDAYQHSQILFLHTDPKRFTGGDLHFPDNGCTIESVNNTCVVFPSYYYHEVSKVTAPNKYSSRYSVTRFYYST